MSVVLHTTMYMRYTGFIINLWKTTCFDINHHLYDVSGGSKWGDPVGVISYIHTGTHFSKLTKLLSRRCTSAQLQLGLPRIDSLIGPSGKAYCASMILLRFFFIESELHSSVLPGFQYRMVRKAICQFVGVGNSFESNVWWSINNYTFLNLYCVLRLFLSQPQR